MNLIVGVPPGAASFQRTQVKGGWWLVVNRALRGSRFLKRALFYTSKDDCC